MAAIADTSRDDQFARELQLELLGRERRRCRAVSDIKQVTTSPPSRPVQTSKPSQSLQNSVYSKKSVTKARADGLVKGLKVKLAAGVRKPAATRKGVAKKAAARKPSPSKNFTKAVESLKDQLSFEKPAPGFEDNSDKSARSESPLSNHSESSFGLTSASSHPSPEARDEEDIITEAEKNDLIEDALQHAQVAPPPGVFLAPKPVLEAATVPPVSATSERPKRGRKRKAALEAITRSTVGPRTKKVNKSIATGPPAVQMGNQGFVLHQSSPIMDSQQSLPNYQGHPIDGQPQQGYPHAVPFGRTPQRMVPVADTMDPRNYQPMMSQPQSMGYSAQQWENTGSVIGYQPVQAESSGPTSQYEIQPRQARAAGPPPQGASAGSYYNQPGHPTAPSNGIAPIQQHVPPVPEPGSHLHSDPFALPPSTEMFAGVPPAWADKRQQLCESLPYYRAYQSGAYISQGVLYGQLIDAENRPTDVFNDEVIITRCGGGRGGSEAVDGRRVQSSHQQSSPIGLAFERNMIHKIPVVVIAGDAYHRNNKILPCRYSVLAHFQVTDVWMEMNDGYRTWCARLEKIELFSQSWWANKHHPRNYDPAAREPEFHRKCEVIQCLHCRFESKRMFRQGFVCLNINCALYFKLTDGNFVHDLDSPEYSHDFKNERTRFVQTRALVPLATPLLTEEDMVINARSGREVLYTKGMVCPQCKCCSRKMEFTSWSCENDTCPFSYSLPTRIISVEEAQPAGLKPDTQFVADGIQVSHWPVGSFNLYEYRIPGPDDKDGNKTTAGFLRHFKSNSAINIQNDGPDDLFALMQKKDSNFDLKRRPVRCPGTAGEILTGHYASNWGATYKFIVAQDSTPFKNAPEVLIKALKKMSWAGQQTFQDIGENFKPFNELLSIGYMEGNSIGYHDDGEKDLGPTIATLSLGAQAEMMLRPKSKSSIGPGRNNAKNTKADVLKVTLNHGDIIIMHGRDLQKYYEHAIKPYGTLRFALTCRHIDPDLVMKNTGDHQKVQDVIDMGTLPEGHEKYDYDGNNVASNDAVLAPDQARSAARINAVQRTLDDLQTMIKGMSPEELGQLDRVTELAAEYKRVLLSTSGISGAPPASDSSSPAISPAAPASVLGSEANSIGTALDVANSSTSSETQIAGEGLVVTSAADGEPQSDTPDITAGVTNMSL